MFPSTCRQSYPQRAFAAAVCFVLAGCVFVPTEAPQEEPGAVAVPLPPADTAPVPADTGPVPAPVRPARATGPREVLVLFEQSAAGQAELAAQLAEQLAADERLRVELADLDAAGAAELIAARRDRPRLVAVAVGYTAARTAAEQLGGPIVFCQVFNHQDLLAEDRAVFGVQSLPPLGLQLRSWRAVDPSLRRVALIVSETHVPLAEEARQAGETLGIDVDYEISTSDRETLYLFKRVGSEVDGLWVVPDNSILSTSVLEEIIEYGLSHGVGALVPNDALLRMGALLSARPTPPDVARAVHSVVERVVAGRTAGLPVLTPLGEAQLRINAAAARRLGLAGPFDSPWVAREYD
jgi:hypothetical protein